MMFYTHLVLAFVIGLLSINYFHPSNVILFMVIVMFGGILPDIDHPKSKLGSYFKLINWLVKHRGILHSLLILPVIALLLSYFNYSFISIPLIIGYIAHLIGDIVTKEGLMLLYPLSDFRINGFIKVGGLLEKLIFIALLILSGYLLLNS